MVIKYKGLPVYEGRGGGGVFSNNTVLITCSSVGSIDSAHMRFLKKPLAALDIGSSSH